MKNLPSYLVKLCSDLVIWFFLHPALTPVQLSHHGQLAMHLPCILPQRVQIASLLLGCFSHPVFQSLPTVLSFLYCFSAVFLFSYCFPAVHAQNSDYSRGHIKITL